MTEYLTRAIILVLSLVVMAPSAHAEWKTQSNGDPDASVRLAYITEIHAHWREVRAAEHHRNRREAREKREAEAAAALAAAAVPSVSSTSPPSYSSSSSGGCLSDAAIASYAGGAGFPESVIDDMVYIAAHRNGTGESGGCPGAVNDTSGACGLWQIYPCPGPDALDPARNAELAYSKYVGAGHSLSPWSF